MPSLLRFLRHAALLACLAVPLAAQLPMTEFTARRDSLVRALPDGVILALGAPEPVPDYIPFRQHPYLFYFTGFTEPGAALVIVKRGTERRDLLFVQGRDPAREVWTGARLGVAGVRPRLGLEGRDAAVLSTVLDSLLTVHQTLHVLGDIGSRMTERSLHDQFIDGLRTANPKIEVNDARREANRLRGRKSPAELERIRIASELSAQGHLAAFAAVQPGVAEFTLQAIAEATWRQAGGDGPAYGSIVGSGPNATTLHYNRSERVAQAGEVIVLDMATSYDGYAADITRTVPVSGRFSPAQREIYAVVLGAQTAAERQIRLGGPARAMTDSATAVLRNGLARVGLIESPEATYDCGSAQQPRSCPQLQLYYMHGLGHGIGLVVHDPEQYTLTGSFGIGSAFTIEPGIYVRENLLTILPDTPGNRRMAAKIAPAVARYANIGVRIEDDYLVTAAGVERVSAAVPREIEAIEALLARPRTPLDPAAVRRFLQLKTGRTDPPR
jgi:Xaa-Pro aminopeptidase